MPDSNFWEYGNLDQYKQDQLAALDQKSKSLPPPSGGIETVLDIFNRPGYGIARGIENIFRSQQGLEPFNPIGEALKTTFGGAFGLPEPRRITGSSLLQEMGAPEGIGTNIAGFGLDVLKDPLTYVPVGLIPKAVGAVAKAAKVIPGVEGTAKVAGKALAPVGEMLGEAFVPRYMLAKYGSQELASKGGELETAMRVAKEVSAAAVREVTKAAGMRKMHWEALPDLYQGTRTAASANLTPDDIQRIQKGVAATHKLLDTNRAADRSVMSGLHDFNSEIYLPGVVDQAALGKLQKGAPGGVTKGLGPFEKPKVFETIAEGKAAGVPYLREDLALELRLEWSQRAQAYHKFVNALPSFADEAGNPIAVAVKKGADAPEGYTFLDARRGGPLSLAVPTEAGGTKLLTVAENLAVRNELLPHMERYLNTLNGRGDGAATLINWYDTALGIWKGSVTSLFPAFVLRNAYGNMFLSWIAGMNIFQIPFYHAKATAAHMGREGVAGAGASAMSYKALIDAERAGGMMGVGMFGADIAPVFERTPGVIGKAMKGVRIGNAAVEDISRTAHVMWRLDQGDTMAQALASAKKFLFSYAPEEFSQFENQVGRRLIPFYAWMRNNIPLQLEQLVNNPGKYSRLGNAYNSLEDRDFTDKERQLMYAQAPYMLERNHMVVGKDEQGRPKILLGVDLPIEDLNMFFGQTPKRILQLLFASMSPILMAPVQAATGESFFTGRPIADQGVQNFYSKAYPILNAAPQPLKDFLGFKVSAVPQDDGTTRYYYNADPEKMFWLTAVLGRFYSTVGKLNDPNRAFGDKMANFLSGAKFTEMDIMRPFAEATQETLAQRQDILNQWGEKAQLMIDNQLTGNQYNDFRSGFMQQQRALFEQDAKRTAEKIGGPQVVMDMEAIKRTLLSPPELELRNFYDLSFESKDPQTGLPLFQDPQTGVVDKLAFFQARDAAVANMSPEARQMLADKNNKFLQSLPEAARTVEIARQYALDLYKLYQAIPKYLGPAKPFADQIDYLIKQHSDLSRVLGPGNSEQAWFQIMRQTPDKQIGLLAQSAAQFRNPLRRIFWSRNPVMARFFSDLEPELVPASAGQ